MAKKLCELCHKNYATLPDRERGGSPVKRICSDCHAERLRGDMACILNASRKRQHDRN